MSRKWLVALAVVLCLPVAWWLVQGMGSRIVPVTPPTEGISSVLATERAANISAVRYALTLKVPTGKQDPVAGTVTIRLNLASRTPLILDFAQAPDRVLAITANGRSAPVRSEHGHLVIAGEFLNRGENVVDVAFTAGDAALNRNDEFLYSLFVPARASLTFPCFDQPDVKASFALTLEAPADWVAVANAPEIARSTSGNRTTWRFGQTLALPTYLFGFAAGKFAVERGERNGRVFHMYHRETDLEKVAANRDAVFDQHAQALEWLENYTGRKYPFEKLDFALMPAFQFSGMEHAGAIFYNAPAILLDKTATQQQFLGRANLIAHETAHMWFGDLVTMKWFDDVWLKEVFANFMAAKIVNPSFPDVNHELRFLLQHYPAAYEVDRTPGTNPIRQTLANLSEAGSLYGPIIYAKAPIVMRQLEEIMGPDQLQEGLREYLSKYAFANATWTDLIEILDSRTDEDLKAWSRAWVDEPGRPTIETVLETSNGNISTLSFTQSDPRGRELVWNQHLQVALGYDHGARLTAIRMNAPRVSLPRVVDLPLPHYILPNGEGTGYGRFVLDPSSKAYFLERLPEVGDGLTRGTAWITLWDDMLESGTPPQAMFDLALRALPLESDEQNTQRILSYAQEIFWRFLSDAQRASAADQFERTLRSGIEASKTTSLKAAYFNAFRASVTSKEGASYLERLWRRQAAIDGLVFAETDYINMAQDLALRGVAATGAILADQHAQITNPDRKARFAFVLPALSPDAQTRDSFFASLARVENRRQERWVADGLRFLNHPLRREHAERYILPSLALVFEVQQTGDIFFPIDWTSGVLSGHNSSAAAATVTGFLQRQMDYPPRLRQIIEQVADPLFRASRIAK